MLLTSTGDADRIDLAVSSASSVFARSPFAPGMTRVNRRNFRALVSGRLNHIVKLRFLSAPSRGAPCRIPAFPRENARRQTRVGPACTGFVRICTEDDVNASEKPEPLLIAKRRSVAPLGRSRSRGTQHASLSNMPDLASTRSGARRDRGTRSDRVCSDG